MKLRHKARIMFRAARIYLLGTYLDGRHCTVPNWRNAVAVALCEDVRATMTKSPPSGGNGK